MHKCHNYHAIIRKLTPRDPSLNTPMSTIGLIDITVGLYMLGRYVTLNNIIELNDLTITV